MIYDCAPVPLTDYRRFAALKRSLAHPRIGLVERNPSLLAEQWENCSAPQVQRL